jgi:hypothetical protein
MIINKLQKWAIAKIIEKYLKKKEKIIKDDSELVKC